MFWINLDWPVAWVSDGAIGGFVTSLVLRKEKVLASWNRES